MAADDDDRGQAPDPWDDIVAGSLGDEGGGEMFQFDEKPADPPAREAGMAGGTPGTPDDAALQAPSAAAAGNPEQPGDDKLVEQWLTASDDDADADLDADAGGAQLSVFPPDDAASSSAIDIGTGSSGIAMHGPAEQEEIGEDVFADAGGASGGGDPAVAWPGVDGDDGDGGAFPAVTAGAAAAAGAVGTTSKTVRRAAKPAKKAGGLGQLVGVVLGGVMAIPITLGILVYGLGKDPFGVTKQVPADVAFLLPEKFRPGYKKPSPQAADEGGESALDGLPAAPDNSVATEEPAAEPIEPAPLVDAEMPAEPEEPATTDVAAIDPPGLDDLAAPPPSAAPAEPPPLDVAALDDAVGEAAALGEALGAVDDRENRAYKLLRTRWYRALARVAEELVAVEHAAATSGRPLASAPDNVAALHGGIGSRETLAAELAALGPDWLAYAKRGSDGVVLPVVFESARRVGPYWAARMTLVAADGSPRDLTIISRTEPAAVSGDRVVVTGVALDGAVIWAADVRAAAAGGDLSAGF